VRNDSCERVGGEKHRPSGCVRGVLAPAVAAVAPRIMGFGPAPGEQERSARAGSDEESSKDVIE